VKLASRLLVFVCAVSLLSGCAGVHSSMSGLDVSPEWPADLDVPAREILAAALDAMGDARSVRSICAAADCRSPRGPYTTTIHARLPDAVVFDQVTSAGDRNYWVVTADDAWAVEENGQLAGDLRPIQRSIALGHAYHAIALDPSLRYSGGIVGEPTTFEGRRCLVVEFRDAFGKPVVFHYDADSRLPVGYTTIEPMSDDDAVIITTFDDWRDVQGVRLFHKARITHRGDVYEFDFCELRLNEVDDELFARPGR